MGRLSVNRLWGVVALALVLVLGIAGCDDLSGPEDSESTSTSALAEETTSTDTVSSTTTTSAPAPTTTTVSVGASEELLPSGNIKAYGYITDVWMDGAVRRLQIDYIEIYWSGPEADAAALADGVIDPGEHVDGWGYVRNNNPLLRTYVVSDSATITTYSRDGDEASADPPCSWASFLSFWGSAGPLPFADSQLHDGKWFIERDGDTVVHIEEFWTP